MTNKTTVGKTKLHWLFHRFLEARSKYFRIHFLLFFEVKSAAVESECRLVRKSEGCRWIVKWICICTVLGTVDLPEALYGLMPHARVRVIVQISPFE